MASRRKKSISEKPERYVSARGVLRTPADLGKLSRGLIRLAMETAATEAAAQSEHKEAVNGSERPHD